MKPEDATNAQERLRFCADRAGGRLTLAEKTGIPLRTLDNYLGGRSELKLPNAAAICDAAGVSLKWLASGRGAVLDPELVPSVLYDEEYEKYVDQATRRFLAERVKPFEDFELIPRYDVHAATGHGVEAAEEHVKHSLAFRRDWLEEHGIDPKWTAVVTARGDSQTGLIDDKSICLVDLRFVRYCGEGVYVIRSDNDLMIKIVDRAPDGTLHIRSRNTEYGSYAVPPKQQDQITFIGCVVWRGGDLPHPQLPEDLLKRSVAYAAAARFPEHATLQDGGPVL